MERVFAFTDESGAFGWQLDNANVSTHFIIGAVIVRESVLDEVRMQVEEIRRKHFQIGEMKSSSIGKKSFSPQTHSFRPAEDRFFYFCRCP